MKILVIPNPAILTDLTSDQRQRIQQAAGDGCQLVVAQSLEEQIQHAPDAHVVFGLLPREAFLVARQLQWVQALSTGAGGMLYPEFTTSDIPLTSNKGLTPQMAEHAFALLLALTRGVVAHARRRGRVENQPGFRRRLEELTGMTMGVLGLGGTGTAVAMRAHAFGMRVIAVNPSPRPPLPFVAEVWKPERFHEFLSVSDVVTICCPLTPATRGLFSREAFRCMKPSAFLINVTRGAIIEEEDLVEALQEGQIAGAGLDDVPRQPDSPLWEMDNVIITSHLAGGSPRSADRSVDRLCANLQHWRNGEPLEGLVDKGKGY